MSQGVKEDWKTYTYYSEYCWECKREIIKVKIRIKSEGNEITLIDVLKADMDDVIDLVQLQMEKNKIYQHIHVLDEREKEVIIGRFGLYGKGAHSKRDRQGVRDIPFLRL